MVAFAPDLPVRSRPQIVAALLDQIEELRQRLYLAQANGVKPAGFRDLKDELRSVREKLAETVG